MFFDRPFLKKQLDSNEKMLWYGRTAVFFSHWGVPVWILMIPAVFFSGRVIFLACNRYRRLFRLLDSTKKYIPV
ncbi:hypothetical protein [uncultured Ruminococcus sp.]|uniref:hypothetical protein n=1 Tax=uncultured Ruminococcus sp. TaxID=165186 RepID=UPI000ECD15CA|nr:hypothetical protein [uncultured Ruminococcus sp.]HCJ40327.1 hypothetical protein [Ruminococcus sp.]